MEGPRRIDPRLQDRRIAIAKARRRRALIAIACVAALAAAAWAVAWSPLLRVRTVRVVGARHTTSDDIARAARLGPSTNILVVSTADVAAATEELPWVLAADVARILPGTVRVKVVERKPALVLTLDAGSWTIDDGGRVLQRGMVADELPVLGGFDTRPPAPGDTLDDPIAVDALRVWRSLPKALEHEVRAIFAPTRERITIVLVDGTQVRYGAAEDLAAKNRVLLALRERIGTGEDAPAYIDVRVPSSPAVSSEGVAPSPTPTASPSPTSTGQ
ncbi:MAG TPA: FtsQ-type POTRA domain-containing protein [Actinomycetota bacterium]|nr:FtsQ-type POTRA domain-containing protein [Actinomycetota bacterium]